MRNVVRPLWWALALALCVGAGCDDGSEAGVADGAADAERGLDGATLDHGGRVDVGADAAGGADAARDGAAGADAEADLGDGLDANTPDLGGDQGVAQGVPVATAAGEAVMAVIGPEGGELVAQDGPRTYTLSVPAGALDAPTEIAITAATLAGLPDEVEAYTAGVILEPSGLRFAQPATLVIEGAQPSALTLGLVFDDVGGVEWQHPAGPDERLSLRIEHFSGAALADIAPGAWGTLLEATGVLPVYTLELVADLSLRDVPDRLLCVAVLTADGRALPQVPVAFELESRLGRLIEVDEQTNGVGNACARWLGQDAPPPEGEEVVIAATPFRNAPFERTVRSRFRWGGDVPDVEMTGLDREQLLLAGETGELCATVSFADISPPLAGYPVQFRSSNPALVAFDHQGLTDATGRFCATWSVAEEIDLDGESVFVDLSAEVPLGPDRLGLALIPVEIESTRLAARVVPGTADRVLAGSASLPVCFDVRRGAQPAVGLTVDFTLEGAGLLSVAAAPTDAQGRACVGYTPPVAPPDAPEIIGAAVAEPGRSANAVHLITVEAPAGAQTYAGTWSSTSSQTRTGLNGIVLDAFTGTSSYQASFRIRREADGSWSGEMAVGGGSASRGEACYLDEPLVLDGISDVRAAPFQGTERLFVQLSGTLTPASSNGICGSLDPVATTIDLFAIREANGRYFLLHEGSDSENQISPDDGSILGNSSYSFREQVEVVPVD